jgi:uncharacterized protein YcaQ
MARALRTLDPELARRLVVSRQRLADPPPAGPARPEAIMDVATDLASLQLDPIGVVDLGQPLPRVWRDGFA